MVTGKKIEVAVLRRALGYAISSFIENEGEWRINGNKEPASEKERAALLNLRDIDEVFYYQKGKNDEESWVLFAKKTDNSYIFFMASCDYTGFDCQGGGCVITSSDFHEIWNFGLTSFVRERTCDFLGVANIE